MLAVVDLASRRARFVALFALAPLLLIPSLGLAALITVPTTLLPGQQYRLAFVTAGSRDARSSSIADYDTFVTAEANTEASLSSISWQMIGSTATVSARVHTSTDPTNYPGVPIFLLNGVKLVDDYADLWDGTLDATFSIDQHGNYRAAAVYTGSSAAGLPAEGGSLGVSTGLVMVGQSFYQYFSLWVVAAYEVPTLMLPEYALSEVLIVPVPEPSPTALLTFGFAALLLVRRVRVQQHWSAQRPNRRLRRPLLHR